MSIGEKIIDLGSVDLVLLFGSNNKKFETIKKLFPDIKIISRGNIVKVIGNVEHINFFESKLNAMLSHVDQYNRLTISQIERIILEDEMNFFQNKKDFILYGNDGKTIKARTSNQREILDLVSKNDIVFAIGPAGTGKTYTSVALAVRALKSKLVKRIILTRPAVEAGESLGFLPGDYKDKLDPYIRPLHDALSDMIPTDKLKEYLENGIIQIAPLGLMRGRTLDQAFVILDEAQNSTESQMKMFLTRMGVSAKFVINGDITQIDLPIHKKSGLFDAQNKLKNIKDIGFVYLDEKDVIRHKLVKTIIKAYKN